MLHRSVCVGVIAAIAAVVACGCSGDDSDSSRPSGSSSPSTSAPVESVVVRGNATLTARRSTRSFSAPPSVTTA